MRRLSAIAGLIVLAIVWIALPVAGASGSFTGHMLAHMGVVAVAAPLLALGLAGTRLDFAARLPTIVSPVTASLFDLLVVWVWHAPVMRNLAEASLVASVFEQASFLVAGLILWLVCLGQGRQSPSESNAAGAFGLLFTSVHMTLLGALLALSARPLYGLGEVSCFGTALSATEDQQIGGVVMLLVGAAAYLAGGVALLARVLNAPTPDRSAVR